MPSRIGFSLWFLNLACYGYGAVREAYFPPFHPQTMEAYRSGAMLAVTGAVLWLGRRHWWRVIRCVGGRIADDEDRQLRIAGLMFLLGCLGIFGWLVWAGVQIWVAVCLVVIVFIITIVCTRLVAETGVPFLRLEGVFPQTLMRMAPVSWFTAGSVFFAIGAIETIVHAGSRVSAAVMATHALGLDESAGGATPRRRVRLAWLLLAVLLIGVVVSGGAHLALNYRHDMSLTGRMPINGMLSMVVEAKVALLEWDSGWFDVPPFNAMAHTAVGALLAAGLYWACLAVPSWPLHPIGLVMIGTGYLNQQWASVFLGWLTKLLILHFGGARLYRSAIPFFVGLIVGEAVAAATWSMVSAVQAGLGLEIVNVHVQPG